ncbi:MAG: N-formylglutamate amidohydrolase [Acetobacteraceae bacterium]
MDVPVDAALAPPAPFVLLRPAQQTVPIIFASPHSGRRYPDELLAASRLDPLSLRRSEDSFVDELFAAAPEHGAPLLAATFPRAWCDANREAWELDPGMFADRLPSWVNTTSARVGAGLGTIARVVASGEVIYRDKLSFIDAERRIRTCWQPFHDALSLLIAETRSAFGYCLLIDCHSMPTHGHVSRSGLRPADIVLGDAHGTACAPGTARMVESLLTDLGFSVRRNDPYAGGYITRHYGRPREGVHALQIELARELYMNEGRIERLPGFAAVQGSITRLIAGLADRLSEIAPG